MRNMKKSYIIIASVILLLMIFLSLLSIFYQNPFALIITTAIGIAVVLLVLIYGKTLPSSLKFSRVNIVAALTIVISIISILTSINTFKGIIASPSYSAAEPNTTKQQATVLASGNITFNLTSHCVDSNLNFISSTIERAEISNYRLNLQFIFTNHGSSDYNFYIYTLELQDLSNGVLINAITPEKAFALSPNTSIALDAIFPFQPVSSESYSLLWNISISGRSIDTLCNFHELTLVF